MKYAVTRSLLAIASLTLVVGCAQIRPDEIGVRTLNFGKDKGIVSKDYAPGYHRFLWPLDTWNRFPSTVQQISFAPETAPIGMGLGTVTHVSLRRFGNLTIISADGDRVTLTSEVFFRIDDNMAHKVLQHIGPGERYVELVHNTAKNAAQAIFGQLRTEDFYEQPRRERARENAAEWMGVELAKHGLDLVDLLVTQIAFDANYERLIKEKVIADQRVELERSKTRAEEERGRVNKIIAETEVKVQMVDREIEADIVRMRTDTDMQVGAMRAEANKYASQRNADASLYRNRRESEGQSRIKQAEADGAHRLNAALAGEGGRKLVAMETVRTMNLTDVTFPSVGYEWFNPFDMVERVGGGTLPHEQQAHHAATAAPNPPAATVPDIDSEQP